MKCKRMRGLFLRRYSDESESNSNNKFVARINLLIFEQNLVNVIRVGVLAGEERAQDLEDVLDTLRVVDIGIADELERLRVAKKRQLEIAVQIKRLEAIR